MRLNGWQKFAVSLILPQCAGMIGGLFTASNIPAWYAYLNKPSFTPPSWVFAPVWLALYLMMGVALFLVWNADTSRPLVRAVLGLFAAQLLLNTAWTFLFFGLRSPFWGLVDIAVLWLALTALVILFMRVRLAAGLLLVPYWVWLSFASVLNYTIWTMN